MHEYNEPTRPTEQIALRAVRPRQHQGRWILAIAHDNTFQLCIGQRRGRRGMRYDQWTPKLHYKQLWQTLTDLDLERRKWWLIGFRMRYLLERAKFLLALEVNDVKLPTSQKRKQEGKRSGRLTISSNCLEIDFVAGANEIKIVDWDNFGIVPGTYAATVETIHDRIAEQVLSDFIVACDSWGMSATRTTAAQIGWAKYRSNHMPPVLSCNRDLDARALERRGYFGGRNEAYRLGEIPGLTYSMDVQGCYAKICRDETLPIHCIEEYRNGLDVDRIDHQGADHWIADVIVNTDAPDYPLQWGNAPVYPTGRFKTTLCWPELSHALQFGRIERVIRAARYDAGKPMERYAQWYLKQRKKIVGTDLERMSRLLKGSFNASLGYTARRKYSCKPWTTDVGLKWFIGHTSAPDGSAPIVQCQILDSIKEWVKIGGEPREAMPMLHATITSWARMQLHSLICWAGRANVLYVDTDGLLVTEEGMRNLAAGPELIGNQPGQLSERFAPAKARIQGQKNYRIGENVVCSGLVSSKHHQWQEKIIAGVPTGHTNAHGFVAPFVFDCHDRGDQAVEWVNELA